MSSRRYAVLLSLIYSCAPLVVFAEDDIADELRRCSIIDDSSARLACYDVLGGRQDSAPTPEPKKSLDDLGTETLSRDARDEKDELAVRVRVTGCQKDAYKKNLFIFDNGQVWKQKSDKRIFLKDCNFDVTITKDFFGYKMQRDGEKRRIRIARVK